MSKNYKKDIKNNMTIKSTKIKLKSNKILQE